MKSSAGPISSETGENYIKTQLFKASGNGINGKQQMNRIYWVTRLKCAAGRLALSAQGFCLRKVRFLLILDRLMPPDPWIGFIFRQALLPWSYK